MIDLTVKHDAFNDLPTIETERLILRKFRIDDAQDVFEYCSDPEVCKYTSWYSHKTLEESMAFIDSTFKEYEEKLTGHWAMVLKEKTKL